MLCINWMKEELHTLDSSLDISSIVLITFVATVHIIASGTAQLWGDLHRRSGTEVRSLAMIPVNSLYSWFNNVMGWSSATNQSPVTLLISLVALSLFESIISSLPSRSLNTLTRSGAIKSLVDFKSYILWQNVSINVSKLSQSLKKIWIIFNGSKGASPSVPLGVW